MAPDKVTVPRSLSSQFPVPSTAGSHGKGSNGNANEYFNGTKSSAGAHGQSDEKAIEMKPVQDLSDMLATGLTGEQLTLCVQLIQKGIPPRMLADFVKRCREPR